MFFILLDGAIILLNSKDSQKSPISFLFEFSYLLWSFNSWHNSNPSDFINGNSCRYVTANKSKVSAPNIFNKFITILWENNVGNPVIKFSFQKEALLSGHLNTWV